MTDNEKYVKRDQARIIWDDPQRYEEVTGANRNKVGDFVRETRLIRAIIATGVLVYTINMIAGLSSDNIVLIVILSGITGSAVEYEK